MDRKRLHLGTACRRAAFGLLAGLAACGRRTAAQEVTATPPMRAGATEVVHTLVARDLMGSVGTGPINIFYAEGTPLLSADGSTAIYFSNRDDGPEGARLSHVYHMPIGGAPRKVDALARGGPGGVGLGIAADGSRAHWPPTKPSPVRRR